MSLAVKVIPTFDSKSMDTSKFDCVPVYNGKIANEIGAPDAQRCFGGAWYYKVLSSVDDWLGIEGVITLGEFTPDEQRFNLDGKGRFMDNPSVYMGGKADFESDAGLGMNSGYLTKDTSKDLDYSSPKVAWRPFWRYIYADVIDESGNVLRRNFNSWNITDPRNFQFYYLPGDKIRMKVYSPKPDYLQLRIEVIEPTTIEKYVRQREAYGLVNNRPSDFYSPIFHSRGQGAKPSEFKRVNSIDQFGNEGKVANMTKAMVTEATWDEVYLYRSIDTQLVKVAFDASRRVIMACPNALAYEIQEKDQGGQVIKIAPINAKE